MVDSCGTCRACKSGEEQKCKKHVCSNIYYNNFLIYCKLLFIYIYIRK
jgi:hypothetical protein